MEIVLKSVAAILITIVLTQVLTKQNKDLSVLLVITVCCMVAAAAFSYLKPIIDFLKSLQALGQLNLEMMQILFKVVGIGLLTEITALICTDMGNASLGKSLQILSVAVILWLSLPLFQKLLDLLDAVLGAV